MSTPLLDGDVREVLDAAGDDLRDLGNARLLITGGTGFVGTWMLETYLAASDAFGLQGELSVLSRDPKAFTEQYPFLASHPRLRVVQGDVRAFPRDLGTFDAIIHAATPASAQVNDETPDVMLDTIVTGMRSVVALAVASGPIPLLFTSSGAVYGLQPPTLSHVDESYTGGPDPLDARNAYHEGKRLAELLGAIAHERHGTAVKIARLFAFVGPRLPIDRHFAIGNFIGDVLGGRPIVVKGDGSPVRSYLYAADMTTWLWRILLRAPAGRAYNVGSEQAVTIAETAHAVAAAGDRATAIEIRQKAGSSPPHRYVPSTARAREELALNESVGLADGITRTFAWHRSVGVSATEAHS
jgi:nucleoside-diphosphate-sugar epimerase